MQSNTDGKQKKKDIKKNALLGKKLNRRNALSTAGKIAISAIVAGVVAGVGGYYAGSITTPAKTVTKAVTKTETVTAPVSTVTLTETVRRTSTTVATTPTQKTITVAVEAGSPHTDVFMKSKVAEFEKETGIKVNWVSIPHEQMHDKFVAELIVGRSGAFDVIQFDGPAIAEFALAKAIEPIDDFASTIDLNDFYEIALEPCRYGDHLYGLPYLVHDQILYYRTDLFEEAGLDPRRPPDTWDELVDYAIKLTRDGIYGFVVEGKGPGHPEPPTKFLDFLYANGGSVFAQDEHDFHTVTLDSPEAYEALQFMVDLLHKYKVCPPGAVGFDCADVHTMFMQGVLAMAHNWPYQFGLAMDPSASKVVGKFDITLMPKKRRRAGAAFAWFLAIPSSSRNKEAAWRFIEYMTSTQVLYELNVFNPGPVPRKSVSKLIQESKEIPDLTKKFISVCTEMVNHGIVNQSKHPKWMTIMADILGGMISEALSLKKTPREAVDNAAAKIREINAELIQQGLI